MITSGIESANQRQVWASAGPDEIFQHPDERWRCVQRLGASQNRASLPGVVGRLHVDVEQDFGVVADEPDRRDQEATSPGSGLFADEGAELGPDPWLGRAARALIRDFKPLDSAPRR